MANAKMISPMKIIGNMVCKFDPVLVATAALVATPTGTTAAKWLGLNVFSISMVGFIFFDFK